MKTPWKQVRDYEKPLRALYNLNNLKNQKEL